jgi:hypothetical protein
MNELDLRQRFPRGSKSFFDANPSVRPEKPEPVARAPLVVAAQGKEKSDGLVELSIVLYRVRLLDPDNAVGATKTITDCLCQIGLLPGDASDQITLQVAQEKVNHFIEQKTVVTITYP